MAEVLESFPSESRGRAAKYDWATWADGRVWKLTHGLDFVCTPRTLSHMAYDYAKKNGLSVRITKTGTDLVLQFSVKKSE